MRQAHDRHHQSTLNSMYRRIGLSKNLLRLKTTSTTALSTTRGFVTMSIQLNKMSPQKPPSSLEQAQQPNDPENQLVQRRELSPEQLAQISQMTSTLYQPKDPFAEPSKSALIEEKIKSIELKLQQQQERAEAKLQKMVYEEYQSLKPTVSDFKRPLTSMFLLASCVYLSLQFLWWHLVIEEHIESMEIKTRAYEHVLQDLLNEQKLIVNGEFNVSETNRKRWWFW